MDKGVKLQLKLQTKQTNNADDQTSEVFSMHLHGVGVSRERERERERGGGGYAEL